MEQGTHSSHIEEEAQKIITGGNKRGGWISFPFITGTVAALSLASAGLWGNLIVYLIQEFNIKSITAAQIFNVVNGTTSLFPFVGAILADSLFGSFPVVLVSSCVSLLGTVVYALTATMKSLRPEACMNGGSNICKGPSGLQYSVLYMGTALAVIGFGGVRFTTATLGANQFDEAEDQGIFFNWFFFTMYVASVIGATALVYIEDSVSWAVGFGICAASNLIGVLIFLLGYRFFRPDNPKGSAFLDLARVPLASIRKWKSHLSPTTHDYYTPHDGIVLPATPGTRFRFFNRAALITDGDLQADGKIRKPWRLCTVQQVEDFKTVIGILPLWTSSIFLSTPIGMQASLTVLQALVMDRHIGTHFQVPAGSVNVIVLLSTSIFLSLLDRVLWPGWQKLTGKSPTPLQRIGVGHVFNVLGMVASALVESKRLKIAHAHMLHNQPNGPTVAMSVLWLFPQLVLVGIGEAFHFPGQVAFYYQQLPHSLRSTSTAMISMLIAIAFYLSTALIDQVRRSTNWLPDDINHGRMDNVYWTLALLGGINFGYYILCATFYKYQKA